MIDSLAVTAAPATEPVVRALADEQQAELAARYGETRVSAPLPADWQVLVLCDGDRSVGCVALQPVSGVQGEVKRMYVRPAWRGRGLSRLLLHAVEELAVARGLASLRLETGSRQPEAIGLYRSSGYVEIPRFAPYEDVEDSLCFAKRLVEAHPATNPCITRPAGLVMHGDTC